MFVDHYEVLQISPNADAETIRRVYRLQAQRFHPDNRESGNPEIFRKISEAYEVLSEPERRATYDREHRLARRQDILGVETPPAAPPLTDETQRREEIIELLYRRRLAHPERPSLGLRDLEVLLRIPKNELEFSLWYLKESGYLTRTDSGHHTITIKGVQFAESIHANLTKRVEAK